MLRFQAVGLAMTMAAVLVAGATIAVLVFLPVVIAFVGLSAYTAGLIRVASMLMLIGLFGAAVGLLYRFGPSRTPPPHQPIVPGTALATGLWLARLRLLSLYVSRIGTFGATYGPLGAAVGVMLWFYISAYAVLLGAELNAQLEARQAAKALANQATG